MTDSTATTLSIFSWNLLSQFNLNNALANPQDWRYSDYREEADWEKKRYQRVIDILKAATEGGDVIAMQEVDCDLFIEDIKPAFESWGWNAVHQWDETDAELDHPPHPWGTAIAYRNDKWELTFRETRSRALVLGLSVKKKESEPQVTIPTSDAQLPSGKKRKKKNDEHTTTPIDWFIVNVHLSAHAEKTPERLRQLESTLWKMSLHAKVDPARARVLVTGDFNSVMSDSPFQYLLQGSFKDEESGTVMQNAFRFENAYRDDDMRPTYYDPRVRERVDHLCFTADTATCVSVLSVPSDAAAPPLGQGLFGPDFPSDHYPVGGQFVSLPIIHQPETQKQDSNECPLTAGQMRVLEFLEAGAPAVKKKKGKKPTEKELAALKAHGESLALFLMHLTPDQKTWVKNWKKNAKAQAGEDNNAALKKRLSHRLSFGGIGFGIAELFQSGPKKHVEFEQGTTELPPSSTSKRRQTITFGKTVQSTNAFDPTVPLPDGGKPQPARKLSLFGRLSGATQPHKTAVKKDLDLV